MTVATPQTDIDARLAAGAAILNVAGGKDTVNIVRAIRQKHPNVPIIATGGNKPDTILATIEAGANAITYTPPSVQELFSEMMARYRS